MCIHLGSQKQNLFIRGRGSLKEHFQCPGDHIHSFTNDWVPNLFNFGASCVHFSGFKRHARISYQRCTSGLLMNDVCVRLWTQVLWYFCRCWAACRHRTCWILWPEMPACSLCSCCFLFQDVHYISPALPPAPPPPSHTQSNKWKVAVDLGDNIVVTFCKELGIKDAQRNLW